MSEQSNKKGKKWYVIIFAVFVLLMFVVSIVSMNIGNKNEDEKKVKPVEKTLTYPEYVCNNLDNGENVFNEVMVRKAEVEKSLNMKIKQIYGNTTKARMADSEGVMCDIDAEICHPQYLFCMNIKMVIPVNYTIWDNWYNKNITYVPPVKNITVVTSDNETVSINISDLTANQKLVKNATN